MFELGDSGLLWWLYLQWDNCLGLNKNQGVGRKTLRDKKQTQLKRCDNIIVLSPSQWYFWGFLWEVLGRFWRALKCRFFRGGLCIPQRRPHIPDTWLQSLLYFSFSHTSKIIIVYLKDMCFLCTNLALSNMVDSTNSMGHLHFDVN